MTLLKSTGGYCAEVADTRAEREKDANESTRNKRVLVFSPPTRRVKKKRGLRVVGCLNFLCGSVKYATYEKLPISLLSHENQAGLQHP